MKIRKMLKTCICAVLIFAFICLPLSSSAAILTFETQYDYDTANIAWLTDLVIKEDMSTVAGLSSRNELIAAPEYPYVETPESFKNDVNYFTLFYTLEEGSQRAAYIYLFNLLNQNSEIIISGVSDDEIKAYLQGEGIKYPASVDSDELVLARALYVAMLSGAFASVYPDGIPADLALEEAIVSYVSTLSGMDIEAIKKWLPAGSALSLDEYIAAAARIALWNNGYTVTADTDENEVFRLIAVMTIEKQGIAADGKLSFEELKIKYMAAMLGMKYNVNVDCTKLSAALESDSVAFYMLQLLGQQASLSIRSDNCTFEEAFELVAKNTTIFDVEDGEFYADIYKYDVYFTNKRTSLWIYPTAYATGMSSATLSVAVNNTVIRNNYYNEYKLDSNLTQQTLKITVNCSSGKNTSLCNYYITVHQGAQLPEEVTQAGSNTTQEETTVVSDSQSVVAGILEKLGFDSSVLSMFDDVYSSLPSSFKKIISVISPTFASGSSASGTQGSTDSSQTAVSDSSFINILDKIGKVVNIIISGVDGISLPEKYGTEEISSYFVTFN